MSIFIYGLVDPRTKDIRYVGKSNKPMRRLTNHIRAALAGSRQHSGRWIAQVVGAGRRPELVILGFAASNEEACLAEREWIARCRDAGFDLTNKTDGGDGQSPGYRWPDEARQKLSAATKGRRISEQHRQNMRAAFNTPEMKAKRREIHANLMASNPEWVAKTSAGMKGRRLSAESKAKMSAAWTPERKARHAEQQKNKPVTPEWKTQLALALKSRWDKYRAAKNGFGNPDNSSPVVERHSVREGAAIQS